MAHVAKKDSLHRRTMEGLSGKSRKLAEWQSEMMTSLESRPEVRFRRLRFNELVIPGDYIKDGEDRYEPWEGPRGFRAASFCKPVYRPEQKAERREQERKDL